MKEPIFVVGANRSGTTLLRLMLNAHSRIAIPEELVYFSKHLAGVRLKHWRTPGYSMAHHCTFVKDFLQRNEEAFKPLDLDTLTKNILGNAVLDLRHPYQFALETWAKHHGKVRWGEKTPGNLFYVDVILDMFPDARFIYIVRDPRAGVYSMMNTPIFSEDVTINALNRYKYMTAGMAMLERFVPIEQWMLVRYEDLVAHPESTAKIICTFLGERYEGNMLGFHKDAERFMKKRAVEDFNDVATKPICVSRIDSWRNNMTSEDVAIIEAICGHGMRRFRYELDGEPLKLSNASMIIVKWAYWKLQCWRHSDTPQYILRHRVLDRSRRRMHRVFEYIGAKKCMAKKQCIHERAS